MDGKFFVHDSQDIFVFDFQRFADDSTETTINGGLTTKKEGEKSVFSVKIGSTSYYGGASLFTTDGLSGASEITLLKSFSLSSGTVGLSSAVVLDLGGHSITSAGDSSVFNVLGNGSLTVKGGESGLIISKGLYGISGVGDVLVQSGAISGKSAAIYNFGSKVFSITGGTLYGGLFANTTNQTDSATGFTVSGGASIITSTGTYTSLDAFFYKNNVTNLFSLAKAGWQTPKTGYSGIWDYVEKPTTGNMLTSVASLSGVSVKVSDDSLSGLKLTPVSNLTTVLSISATDAPFSATDTKFTFFDGSAAGKNFSLSIAGNNTINSILGGSGADTLAAGGVSTILNGGDGNDYLIGGSKADTFVFGSGEDSIQSYTDGADVVSLLSVAAITDPSSISYTNGGTSILKLNFGNNNSLTFEGVASVSVVDASGSSYYYTNNLIIMNGTSAVLGAGYSSSFAVANTAFSGLQMIDGSRVKTGGISITGNKDKPTYIIGSNEVKTSLYGGGASNTLEAGSVGAFLFGGTSDDLLIGAEKVSDTFVFGGGSDTIKGFKIGEDVVSLTGGISAITDTSKVTYATTGDGTSSIKLTFGTNSSITFEGFDSKDAAAVSVISGSGSSYYYTPDMIVENGKSVSLSAGFSSTFNEANFKAEYLRFSDLVSIDAAAVSVKSIAIYGNKGNNYILGSDSVAVSLIGNAGNDTLKAGTSGAYLDGGEGNDYLIGGISADTFVFGGGSDTIGGYSMALDTIILSDITALTDPSKITYNATAQAGSHSGLRLDFSVGNKVNILTLEGVSVASIRSGGGSIYDTYCYEPTFIVKDGTSITLRSDYKTSFASGSAGYSDSLETIDASAVTLSDFNITGNTKDNYIIGGISKGGSIIGGGGADSLIAWGEGASLVGGASTDSLVAHSIKSYLEGGGGSDTLIAYGASATLIGGKDNDLLYAWGELSSLGGGSGNDMLYAYGKNSSLFGEDDDDTLVASSVGTYLDGGKGNDSLVGGAGADTFIFGGGNDTIEKYTFGEDVVSLTGIAALTDAESISYADRNLTLNFSASALSSIKFVAVSKVAILGGASGQDTYTYDKNSIVFNDMSISLKSDYGTSFNATKSGFEKLESIDASHVNTAINITGNDKNNYIIGGISGGTLTGNAETSDSLFAAEKRSEGATYIFNYKGGDDYIGGYSFAGGDLIKTTNTFRPTADHISIGGGSTSNLVLTFEDGGSIILGGASNSEVSLTSGSTKYTFTKDQLALNKGVTLTTNYASISFAGTNFDTIDAHFVAKEVSISGNDAKNVIIGSASGGTIHAGGGNDKIDVTGRATGNYSASYLFEYTGGKDAVSGFDFKKDLLSITDESIKSAKATETKFTITVDKSNTLTLNGEGINMVSLESGGYITSDGVVTTPAKASTDKAEGNSDRTTTSTTPTDEEGDSAKIGTLTLFSGTKGDVDLNDDVYTAGGVSITTVDATAVTGQAINIIAGSLGGAFNFKDGNKKKDTFTFGGASATISGYEAGIDKINLGDASIAAFSVSSTLSNSDVMLSISGGISGTITLKGASDKEVLIHDGNMRGNSYSKMVFADGGVLKDKAGNKATSVTLVAGGASSYEPGFNKVKKITFSGGASGINAKAFGTTATTFNASVAGENVTLTGSSKNDKLIGSNNDDVFVYTGGKDVIQNFQTASENGGDMISLMSGTNNNTISVETLSKISASDKSVKLTFARSSDVLNIKATSGLKTSGAKFVSLTESTGEDGNSTSAVSPNTYTFAKNAIISDTDNGKQATLTSAASGTVKAKTLGEGVTTIDGRNVNKNLTLAGDKDAAETFIGGLKKTVFKGGGGDDSLIGGKGKDTFFYAKGNEGDVIIENFDFANDNIKVANGVISKISKEDGGIKFEFTDGKRNNPTDMGSFHIQSWIDYNSTEQPEGKTFNETNVLIKANNNYYWFSEAGGQSVANSSENETVGANLLITSVTKPTSDIIQGYKVIDLTYSTDLTKGTEPVAIKVSANDALKESDK